MSIDDLYDNLLNDNVDMTLSGEIEIEEESIRWTYDGLGKVFTEMEEHLGETLDTDRDTLDEFLLENKVTDKFYFGQPEINDTTIALYIYEE
jgi:hypothetical protein